MSPIEVVIFYDAKRPCWSFKMFLWEKLCFEATFLIVLCRTFCNNCVLNFANSRIPVHFSSHWSTQRRNSCFCRMDPFWFVHLSIPGILEYCSIPKSGRQLKCNTKVLQNRCRDSWDYLVIYGSGFKFFPAIVSRIAFWFMSNIPGPRRVPILTSSSVLCYWNSPRIRTTLWPASLAR